MAEESTQSFTKRTHLVSSILSNMSVSLTHSLAALPSLHFTLIMVNPYPYPPAPRPEIGFLASAVCCLSLRRLSHPAKNERFTSSWSNEDRTEARGHGCGPPQIHAPYGGHTWHVVQHKSTSTCCEIRIRRGGLSLSADS